MFKNKKSGYICSMRKYKGGDPMTIVACITALYGISVCLKAIKKLS